MERITLILSWQYSLSEKQMTGSEWYSLKKEEECIHYTSSTLFSQENNKNMEINWIAKKA